MQAKRPNALRVSARWTPLASVFCTGLFDFLERLFDCRGAPVCGCAAIYYLRSAAAIQLLRDEPLKDRWRWPVSCWQRHAFLRECDASLRAQIGCHFSAVFYKVVHHGRRLEDLVMESPRSQPFLVPKRPRVSRSASSRVTRGSICKFFVYPLIFSETGTVPTDGGASATSVAG